MIGRRSVLGGMAAMMGQGGLPPMRPDQALGLPQTRAGTGPAPQNLFVVARRVVVFGPGGSGVFVYSPSPGPGNLVASIVAQAGTDPYGNAYLAGVVSYGGGSFSQLDSGQVSLGVQGSPGTPCTASNNGEGELLLESGQFSGGDTQSYLVLRSLLNNSGPTASVAIGTAPGAGIGGTGLAALEVLGGIAVKDTIGKIVGGVIDTPHPLGALGVGGITITTATYVLLADGGVFISVKGSCTAGPVASGSGTFANAMPAAYQPATTTLLPAMYGGAIAAGENRPRLQVNPNGTVTLVFPGLATGNFISGGGRYDLS